MLEVFTSLASKPITHEQLVHTNRGTNTSEWRARGPSLLSWLAALRAALPLPLRLRPSQGLLEGQHCWRG